MAVKLEYEYIDSDVDIQLYDDNYNYKIIAGPGAGKTYLIVQNIKNIIQNSKKIKQDKERKICCITYTNVAVNEIRMRIGENVRYTHISTIHSFLYEHVIKPFNEQLRCMLNELLDIKIKPKKKFTVRREGVSLLYEYKLEDISQYLSKNGVDTWNVKSKNDYEQVQYDIGKIEIDKVNKDYDFPFAEIKPSWKDKFDLKNKRLIKKLLLQEYAVLDFSDILLFSGLLANKYEHIAYYLRYMFPYLIIDEYQDTVMAQNYFIKKVFDHKMSSIMVVGDPAQSIYSFAGAKYKEFYNFNTKNKLMLTKVILGNRRSGKNIISFLNYLRENDNFLPMQEPTGEEKEDGLVTFILDDMPYERCDILKIVDNDVNVLTRRWADAFLYLDNLNSDQRKHIKEIHSIWTYLIGRDLFYDFETGKEKWVSQMVFISNILEGIENGNFYLIMQELTKLFVVEDVFAGKADSSTIKNIFAFIDSISNIKYLDNYFEIVEKINYEAEKLGLAIKEKFENKSATKRYEDLYVHLNQLTFDSIQMIVKKIFVKDGKYTSIHKTKGKEYTSVLTDFEVADFHNHYDLAMLEKRDMFGDIDNTSEEVNTINEYLRIAYVACSRAIKNLYIHIKGDEQDFARLKSVMDSYIEKHNIAKFYDIKYVSQYLKSNENK